VKPILGFFSTVLFLINCSQSYYRPELIWTEQESQTTASLRGLSVVNAATAWASGSGGTVLRTTDKGNTWQTIPVTGFENLDFRDVHAFSGTNAIILSAGSPAVILKTADGGTTWRQT